MKNNNLTWAGLFIMVAVPFLVLWFFGSRPASINKIVEVGNLLENSPNKVELVFFGFVGCESICPSALTRISEALKMVDAEDSELAVGALFAEINYHRASNMASNYAAGISGSGHKLIGVDLKEHEVRELSQVFGLRIINNGMTTSDIQHTDHLFVLRKADENWVLEAVLPTATPANKIKETLIRAARFS
ncbi:MAG: SCO family protein [Balneolia bacterium]|nr:SCO family protein [Balneolia bacterium]